MNLYICLSFSNSSRIAYRIWINLHYFQLPVHSVVA